MQDNAAIRASVRRAEKAARQRDLRRREFLVTALSTTGGKEYFWELFERGHVFVTTFDTGSPYATSYKEGYRALALSVLADITTFCPEKLIEMMQERNASLVVATMEQVDDGTDDADYAESSADGTDAGE